MFPNAFPVSSPSKDDSTFTQDTTSEDGSTGSDPEIAGLARSLLEDNDTTMSQGEMINEAINYNVNSFVPSSMFENLVKDYKTAEQIYGPKLIREVSGFAPETVQRNAKIPEFQRELKQNIGSRIKAMRQEGLIDEHGALQDKGATLASLVMCFEELDKLVPKGVLGEHVHKYIKDPYGVRGDSRTYRKGDRFTDIDIGKTIKMVVRRGHKNIRPSDLRVHERIKKGKVTIVYAIDASGSMRGRKIEMCKKAGVALSYKATQQHNDVGLLVFSSQIVQSVEPTREFYTLLKNIVGIQASKETNMATMIEDAIKLFKGGQGTKHLMILTDGTPTVGSDPQVLTLQAAQRARATGITISMIGIQLAEDDAEFARRLVDIGGGKLYVVNNLDNLDMIVLQDYDSYT